LFRRSVFAIAIVWSLCSLAPAQAPPSTVKEITAWPEGTADLNDGWRMQSGDDPAWAQPGYDDSAWQVVSLAARSMDARQDPPIGFVWYRLHLRLPSSRPAMGVLLTLPENAYEVFVNGRPAGAARIGSPLTVYFPVSHFVPLPDGVQDLEVAVRTRAILYIRLCYGVSDPFYGAWVGSARVARAFADRSRLDRMASRQNGVLPTQALDMVVVFGGLAVLALFLSQRTVEYLWLSVYLMLIGLADLSYAAAFHGLLPCSFNSLFADPAIFVYLLIQIEFTFAFAHRRLSHGWRAFQALLALMTVAGLCSNTFALFPIAYSAVQAALQLIVSLTLPILLLAWFRRGNREVAWIIVPSFLNLPGAVFDTAWVADRLHFIHLESDLPLVSFAIGSIRLMTSAAMNFLYLVAIGIVLFVRYTRVMREQARTTAELEAAREIQSRLVPLELPQIEGCCVRAAYVPAAEVGGDFFQVLRQDDGSALIAVGDVSGKGLRAAMTGTLAIGALRTLADQGMSPAKLLSALNRQLLQAGQGGFVTMLCARLGPDGTLTLANAGHLYPYSNGIEVALETGMPLGITIDADYVETTVRLNPGDTFTFLSDGVVEARRADGELFGFERAQAISGKSPQEIAEAAQEFGQEDDITVLTLALTPANVLV
jgi:hypothetical protein